jgi:hypothetical protein
VWDKADWPATFGNFNDASCQKQDISIGLSVPKQVVHYLDRSVVAVHWRTNRVF